MKKSFLVEFQDDTNLDFLTQSFVKDIILTSTTYINKDIINIKDVTGKI